MTDHALENQSQALRQRVGNATGLLWISSGLVVLLAITLSLGLLDDRMLNGVSIWDKPAKFSFSLALHAVTLAWGLTLVPDQTRNRKSIWWATNLFILAVILEMSWMTFQASRGEASHFNTATPFTSFMYTLMGIGAVTLTTVTIFFGWKIARARSTVMHFAAGSGFLLAGVLTTIVASYMSSTTGHSVGGDLTDATGVGFFHWSTTGGDLRVPHFAALHIAQALPLLAWLFPDRRVVIAGLVLSVLAVAALFIQAMMGIPMLRV